MLQLRAGAGLLRAFLLGPPKFSQNRLSKAIRVPQQTISAWIRGNSRPSESRRKLIERVTAGAVPASSWLTDEEAEALRLADSFASELSPLESLAANDSSPPEAA